MPRIKPVLTLLFSLLLTLLAQAQEEMKLADLVNQALEENYQIRITENQMEAARNSNTIGNAGMLPQIDFLAERRLAINNSEQEFFTGDSQSATNARRNATSLGIGATWVVFDGLAMFGRKDRLEQLELLSEADRRFFIEQTVADIATSYYLLKQETQLLETYRQALDVSQTRLEFEDRALEIGASNQLDRYLALANRNADSALVVGQAARIRELTYTINRNVNRDLNAPIIPVDSIQLGKNYVLSELSALAEQKNAQLDVQQLQELIALSETKIARGALFPEVELFGNYNFDRQTNEVGFLESSRTFGPDLGVRIRFNLYSGGQERIQSQNASLALESEKLRTADVALEVNTALQTAFLRWENSRQQVALELAGKQAANKALTIAQRQFELGTITIVDFRVIQQTAIEAETRFLRAAFEAKSREIELLRISGRLLEEVL